MRRQARVARVWCARRCANGGWRTTSSRGCGARRASNLGPSTQEEIAVAILAELAAWSHSREGSAAQLLEATDPVCGMTVSTAAADVTCDHDGVTYYFCCPGCRTMFEADPRKALATVRPTFG